MSEAVESGFVTVVVGRFPPLVLAGLTVTLSEDRRVRLPAVDVEDAALERVVMRQAPRVAILDEPAAGWAPGRLREIAPATGVLILAHEPSRSYGMRMLAAGATCLARNLSGAELLEVVHLVADGERMFISADGVRVRRCYPRCAPSLTSRETDVLQCLSEGKTYAELAHELQMGVRTAHTHAVQVYRKLNVTNKQELIGMPIPRAEKAR